MLQQWRLKLGITLRKYAHEVYRDFFPSVKIENFTRKILIFLICLLKTYIVGKR